MKQRVKLGIAAVAWTLALGGCGGIGEPVDRVGMSWGGGDCVSLQRVSDNRYLDAYSTGDHQAVTRPDRQLDGTQDWCLGLHSPGVFSLQQGSFTGPVLDAYHFTNDQRAVLRPLRFATADASQLWVAERISTYWRFSQYDTGRYLDAYSTSANQHRVVTRSYQNNNTQLWRVTVTTGVGGASAGGAPGEGTAGMPIQ
jgi:hypothetical protein